MVEESALVSVAPPMPDPRVMELATTPVAVDVVEALVLVPFKPFTPQVTKLDCAVSLGDVRTSARAKSAAVRWSGVFVFMGSAGVGGLQWAVGRVWQ